MPTKRKPTKRSKDAESESQRAGAGSGEGARSQLDSRRRVEEFRRERTRQQRAAREDDSAGVTLADAVADPEATGSIPRVSVEAIAASVASRQSDSDDANELATASAQPDANTNTQPGANTPTDANASDRLDDDASCEGETDAEQGLPSGEDILYGVDNESEAEPDAEIDWEVKRAEVRAAARRAREGREDNDASAPTKQIKPVTVVFAILGVVLLLALVVGVWARWFAHDDAADIQGTWTQAGSSSSITISQDSITLDAETTYTYTLDGGPKSISVSFGTMSGTARYRFNSDRTQVAIIDGSYSAFDTIIADISYAIQGLLSTGQTGEPLSPDWGYSNAIVLVRPSSVK